MPSCQECGKKFKSITNTHLEKNHKISLKEYQNKYIGVQIRDADVVRKMYLNHSQTLSRLRREGVVVSPPLTEEARRNASQRMKNNNPMKKLGVVEKVKRTKREKFEAGLYDFSRTPEQRKRYSEAKIGDKNPMKRPEVYIKNAKAHNRKKSGIELMFDEVIKKYKLPLEYVGNNKFWIGAKNPDYINKERKLVVEVTSDAYKRLETNYEVDRITHFKKYGYNTITVRYTSCLKKYIQNRNNSFGETLNKIIYEDSSYQLYHSKTGEISCVQFRN